MNNCEGITCDVRRIFLLLFSSESFEAAFQEKTKKLPSVSDNHAVCRAWQRQFSGLVEFLADVLKRKNHKNLHYCDELVDGYLSRATIFADGAAELRVGHCLVPRRRVNFSR